MSKPIMNRESSFKRRTRKINLDEEYNDYYQSGGKINSLKLIFLNQEYIREIKENLALEVLQDLGIYE